ncbi:hypothetical protein [Actinomycetospora soli]|uniref:hypothetical protein n=1 Tax=Actinomycetospora soli TaxID=2893887 RepID=UPI001E4CC330|nr:hypothetical protein [Actinomycetospora soli]MCD2186074.1 hypothetical protein [Actinomycetospora soli]
MADEVLLDVGAPGARLVVRLGEPFAPHHVDPETRCWRHAEIVVDAAPFAGTIRTILTGDDVERYRAGIAALLADEEASVVLGGDRAAEVRLDREGDAVIVAATPSGDDPWPTIRYALHLA